MKAGVAEASGECIVRLSGCTAPTAYDCVRSALGNACPDASANEACNLYAGICTAPYAISASDCHKLIDGLNAAGRQKVATCVLTPPGTTLKCQSDIWSCIEGL